MRDLELDSRLAPLVASGQNTAEEVTEAVLSQLDRMERDRIIRALVLDKARRSIAARQALRPTRPVAVPDPEPEVMEDPVEDIPRRVSPVRLAPTPPASAKVAGIRDWWSDLLRQEVQVGGRAKVVADCTAEDVEAISRQRMGAAQRMAKNAQGMAALAAQMRAHNARTVKDLPRTHARGALAS